MADWNLSDAYGEQKGDVLSLELGPGLYEPLLADPDFTGQIQAVRKEVFRQLGVYLPSVRIRSQSELEPNQYQIRIRGNRIVDGVLHPPLLFSHVIESGTMGLHPIDQVEGRWNSREGEEAATILLNHLRQVINRRLDQLVTYDWVARWLKQAKSHSPDLVKELEERGLTSGILWSVTKLLLKDRIPLHPFEELLETVLDYFLVHPHEGYTPPEWTHPHPSEIAKYVSQKKKDRRLPHPTHKGKVIGFNK
ncbi:FHIPEP family type III secretion protein [Desmospora profundinema]|uniref:Flagellar biosynthesis component FlhA n=1 Tax=Desmospora profundinema TaxID=1571184 RepID=A0ABU1ILT0_9BACL|nr:FHIPEP family type III secretion protein [Desmospora profundinema]MDR6225739.1 flagellar biosynthesis component FlhA [Desmospora profundinema]